MSAFDVLGNIGFFASSWPIPEDVPNIAFNIGTPVTCAIQGFVIQAALGAVFYNGCLAINYLTLIYLSWHQDKLRKLEPFLHLLAIGFPFSTSVALAFMNAFGNANLWCWIRGEFKLYQYLFFYGPLWFIWLFVCISMVLVWQRVFSQESQVSQYFQNGEAAPKSKSREVAKQGALYVLALCMTWIFGTTNRTYQAITGESIFPLLFLHSLFVPLQGFLNFIVFARPIYKRRRASYPDASTLKLVIHFCCPSLMPLEENKHKTKSLKKFGSRTLNMFSRPKNSHDIRESSNMVDSKVEDLCDEVNRCANNVAVV